MRTAAILLMMATHGAAATLSYNGLENDVIAVVDRPPARPAAVRPVHTIDVVAGMTSLQLDAWEIRDEVNDQIIWTATPGTYPMEPIPERPQTLYTTTPVPFVDANGSTVLTTLQNIRDNFWGLQTLSPKLPDVTIGTELWQMPVAFFVIPEPSGAVLAAIAAGLVAFVLGRMVGRPDTPIRCRTCGMRFDTED